MKALFSQNLSSRGEIYEEKMHINNFSMTSRSDEAVRAVPVIFLIFWFRKANASRFFRIKGFERRSYVKFSLKTEHYAQSYDQKRENYSVNRFFRAGLAGLARFASLAVLALI